MKKNSLYFVLLAIVAFLIFLAACNAVDVVDIDTDDRFAEWSIFDPLYADSWIAYCTSTGKTDPSCMPPSSSSEEWPEPESSSSVGGGGGDEESSSSAGGGGDEESSSSANRSSSAGGSSSSTTDSSSSGGSSSSGNSSSGGSSSSVASSSSRSSSSAASSSSRSSSSSVPSSSSNGGASSSSQQQQGGGTTITLEGLSGNSEDDDAKFNRATVISGTKTVKCGGGNGNSFLCVPVHPCNNSGGFAVKVGSENKSIFSWQCSSGNDKNFQSLGTCSGSNEFEVIVASGESIKCIKGY